MFSTMLKFIHTSWFAVMDNKINPLKHIPDTAVRHLVMQLLAWMWCIVFSFYIGSWVVFGISIVAHVILIATICVTVITFETAKRKPNVFAGLGRKYNGEHE
tara:strand:+ start:170 stop:475 length:306 start_codon:yes stop_codon:yes gene_type:complete